MTSIVNLRQARKQRARDAKRQTGDANAARFGEPAHLRDLRQAEAARAAQTLEAHRQDDPASDND